MGNDNIERALYRASGWPAACLALAETAGVAAPLVDPARRPKWQKRHCCHANPTQIF